ncbi:oxidoreductase-like protein [Calycina marina]|uniref:Oxidoreductase-like protein n=1 Tax=Calycina marina TaxID=1763456 RepID=A0A9P7YUX6_9HELO|nr:oxidoreductase-like protein [Calycina marina]
MENTSDNTMRIPVLDIAGSGTDPTVAKAIVDAAATYGFIYIRNQGEDIPVEAINNAFELSKKFFASPIEEKEPCKILENNRGWSGMHSETLDAKHQRTGDFKEAFNFGEFDNGKAQQVLSPALANHEKAASDFSDYCKNLVLKILTLFAIGLEIDNTSGGSEWFSSRHKNGPSGCTLRLLHYPAIPPGSDFQPEVDIRAGAHSDYGSITLLFQRPGQPGLEIVPPSSHPEDRADGTVVAETQWMPVPVFPPGTENDPSPPILVNIGDLLSYWTNNLLKSTVHRVVFPKGEAEGGADRYSIAYFAHPVSSTVLESIPSKMVRNLKQLNGVGPEGKKAITAHDHLMGRLKASYLDLYQDDKDGEEERLKETA